MRSASAMLPLDSLLHRLESAGFRISPADRLRVVQLLEAMGNECLENPQKLRLLLAPILARSAAEQAKFYEVFDSWMPKPMAGLTPSHPANKRLRWLLAAGLVVAILLVAGYFKYCDSSTNNQVIQGPVQSGVVDTLKTKPAQNEGKTPLKEEKEILKPELPVKNLLLAKEKELPRPAWPAWSLLGILILTSAWMWWKWTRRSRPLPPEAKPLQGPAGIIQGEIADAPPYTIPFRGQEAYIRTGREQYRLADAMRQRQQGEHPYMDVPASVQATLDKGGFPTLRFRMRRQPADYLCIMEEKHRQSHLARLFQFFTEHIRGQDVALEIFQASGTMDRFWNARHPGGLTLEQLQRLYPAHRLIVFGDAHALLDISASGAARVRPEMGAAFRRWRQRVLFTPNAPIAWTFEEKALYDLFVLFPATLQGMNDAAHHIEASVGVTADDEAPPSFARWREQAQQRGQSVQGGEDHRYTRWRDASDHEEYLAGRPDLLLWLRALAVYPVPTWEITLAIGQSLEKQGVTVRPDDLLILSRIGWLQNGRMPAGLREEFMEDLPPEAETAARQAVIAALEEARAEAGNGFAGIELGVNVAIQEFALAPHDPEKQEVMRLLFEAGRVNKAQEQVADLALAKTSEVSKTSKGAQPLSAREFVKKAVEETPEAEPPKRPFFTRHFWIAIGLTLCAVGFGLLMYMLWFFLSWIPEEEKNRDWAQRNLFDWQVQTDSATIWNNRGVQVWNERRDTINAIRWFNDAVNSTPPKDAAEREALLLKMAANIANDTSQAPATVGTYSDIVIDSMFIMMLNGSRVAGLNLDRLSYNLAIELLNAQFAQLPLPPENLRAYRELPEKYFGSGYAPGGIDSCVVALTGISQTSNPSVKNDALHALGLAHLYRFRRDSAVACYERLIKQDSTYFINLRSTRPNLETLLGKLTNRVISVETGTDAGGKLQGRIYFQLKDNPRAPIQLQAELLDKNGQVLAQTTVPQRGAAKGLNQNTFTLPSDANMPAFVADSLRVKVLLQRENSKVLALWTSVNRFVWNPQVVPQGIIDFAFPGVVRDLLNNPKTRPALNNLDNYKIRQLKGIVLHWTASDGSAKQIRDFMDKSTQNGSVHFIVDEQSIIQCVPVNEVAYHIGSIRYTQKALDLTGSSGLNPNYFTIGVEMCDSDNGKRDWSRTYQNTVQFVRQLLQKYDLTVNNLYRHSELVPDRPCPKKFLEDATWEQFKRDIEGSFKPFDVDKNPSDPKEDPTTGTQGLAGDQKEACIKLIKAARAFYLTREYKYALQRLEAAMACDSSLVNEIEQMRQAIQTEVKEANISRVISQIASNMVPVPGGTFTMGSDDKDADECPHKVTVPSFRISKYEVTQAQWRAVMGADPPKLYNKGCDECPVDNVSWDDVQRFLIKLKELSREDYRLPTEAEWEYAARGGPVGGESAYQYSGSDNLDEVGWWAGNSKEGNTFGEQKATHPVGQKKPNQLGLYDMSGNVYEWCQDTYGPYPCDKKTEKETNSRVLRGGSWSGYPAEWRVASRIWDDPSNRHAFVGFRVARDY
ncbi:MAG TPA: SUMF1/EgtB/PvdO family nonheme iron enzyme [Saprospiraceae bacterium]|nr:SUMF1/EgtB/PvdO family nonheme iron enzyme [Saprospiraceae bacterium]